MMSRHVCSLFILPLAALVLAACPDGAPGSDAGSEKDAGGLNADGGETPTDGGAREDGGAGNDGGVGNDGGETPTDGGAPAGDWTPPAGPYVLVSKVATGQGDEDNLLVTGAGPFDVEVRVGHVSDVRTFGFVLGWDPAVLTPVSRERVDGWLTSNGGSIVPLSDEVSAAAGTFHFVAGLAGQGAAVSTATSEAIYRLTFDFASAPVETSLSVDLSQDGLVQDGANEPIADVTEASLTVRPD